MMTVSDIREWLDDRADTDLVGIADDGMSLEIVGEDRYVVFLEVGAMPERDEVTA